MKPLYTWLGVFMLGFIMLVGPVLAAPVERAGGPLKSAPVPVQMMIKEMP